MHCTHGLAELAHACMQAGSCLVPYSTLCPASCLLSWLMPRPTHHVVPCILPAELAHTLSCTPRPTCTSPPELAQRQHNRLAPISYCLFAFYLLPTCLLPAACLYPHAAYKPAQPTCLPCCQFGQARPARPGWSAWVN